MSPIPSTSDAISSAGPPKAAAGPRPKVIDNRVLLMGLDDPAVLTKGICVDARDSEGKWIESTVAELRLSSSGVLVAAKMHFKGFDEKWDEWIEIVLAAGNPCLEVRLAPARLFSAKQLAHFFTPGAEVTVRLWHPPRRWVRGNIKQVDGDQLLVVHDPEDLVACPINYNDSALPTLSSVRRSRSQRPARFW
jgi:hypothetical protein